MKKQFIFIFAFCFLSVIVLAGTQTFKWDGYVFHLNCANIGACKSETKTFNLLKKLIRNYHVAPWVREWTIHIQKGVASRSTSLTINTHYNDDPHCLLSIFLHEQIHKIESAQPRRFQCAMKRVEKNFPKLPPSYASDKVKTYRHFSVGSLEFEALEKLLGRKEALRIFKKKQIYAWIQKMVLGNWKKLRRIYNHCNLRFI